MIIPALDLLIRGLNEVIKGIDASTLGLAGIKQVKLVPLIGGGAGGAAVSMAPSTAAQNAVALSKSNMANALATYASGVQGITAFQPSAATAAAAFKSVAAQYGLSPQTLRGVYGTETGYGSNQNTSSAGAVGPFQSPRRAKATA